VIFLRQKYAKYSALAVALAAAPSPAYAGAWTLPAGKGQIIGSLLGWLGQGPSSGAPSASRESKVAAQTYLEYGLVERLTLLGQLSAERYALLAPPTRDVYAGLGYSGAGLRARLWSDDAWVFSMEASVYASGASDPRRPAQAGDTGPAVDMRALVGRNLMLYGVPAFVDGEAGYRVRTRGPPSEWHADLTLGIAWTPRVQILLQLFNTMSDRADGARFASWESYKGQLSVVYALDAEWSLQLGGFATLHRRNVNSENGVLVAVWRRF
jgi:hypothetical protein